MQTDRVREILVRKILMGAYGPGDNVPTEREMAATVGVSRVTVRRAYDQLEKARVIVRRRRTGTIVNDDTGASTEPIESVAFLSTAWNEFAIAFGYEFEREASRRGALLILRMTDLKPEREERAAIDLVAAGVRNLVVWPSGGGLPDGAFPRMRALGVNMVFVDRVMPGPYADYVGLDSVHAMLNVSRHAVAAGCARFVFVAHSEMISDPERLCEEALVGTCGARNMEVSIVRAPWDDNEQRRNIGQLGLELGINDATTAIVGANDYLALSVHRCFPDRKRVYSVGGMRMLSGTGVVSYRAPVAEMARAAWRCLERQRRLGRRWKSERRLLKGALWDSSRTVL